MCDDRGQIERLRADWLGGGPASPLIKELIRLKRFDEAGTLARLALASEGCEDRPLLEELLDKAGRPPPGWAEAVLAFSEEPSAEGWDALMRFTPDDVFYQRTRNTLRVLRRMGTDPNVLFACATRYGIVPDAIELVQSGEVDPESVVERATKAPPGARTFWYGLAAEAAFARGDDLGTVRLLMTAYSEPTEELGPEISVMAIREKAGPELQAMLDKVGFPRFES